MKFKIISLAAMLFFILSPAYGDLKKNILYLNSYQNGYVWSDSILEGIRSVIDKAPYPVSLQIEYMDSKKYYDTEIERLLFTYYEYKYTKAEFDAIIVSDNTAFEFMLRHREKLFPDIPLIFCGVNNFSDRIIADQKKITGVAERLEFSENLKIARSLHPESRRLIIIGNESITCRAIVKQIQNEIQNESIHFDIRFMTRFSSRELTKELKKLPPDTLIFFLPFYEKKDRDFISSREIMGMVYEQTGLPIFSSWDFFIGAGIVGGRLTSGIQNGKTAAGLALRILAGENPDALEVITKAEDQYIFDYNILKHFGINKDRLPRGSEIINAPSPFYKVGKKTAWGLFSVFVILSCILFILVLNIMKRKEMERELRKAEEKYRNIFKNTAKGIVIFDYDGSIVEMNPAFAQIFGYVSVEKFLARNKGMDHLFVSKQKLKTLLDLIFRKKRKVTGFELEFHHLSGDIRWALITAKSVFYSGWKKQMIECICEDITQRKKAQIALKSSREKLRLILDSIPQLVFWQDYDLRFMEVNKSFASFFKLKSPKEIIGKNDYNLLGIGENAQRALKMNRKVINTNKPQYRIKWEFKKTGKETIWLEINKMPLHDENGKIIGILSTAEDITQKTNLEKQLMQSQKMEALGILSGGIAHDFNNILTSIINSTELAIEDVPMDSITKKDLERVLKAGRRGSNLVKRILTFSRPTHHEFRPVDVHKITKEALGLIQTSLPGNIDIVNQITPDLGFCMGNPTQIHQVIMNLCANSFQAMEKTGGKFEISLDEIILDPADADMLNVSPGPYVFLVIADNGPGITPAILDKIFDPFFTTKRKDMGTGLGLSVVHGIIKSHKGAVRVESTPFERTEFKIYLPQIKEAAAAETGPTPSSFAGHEKILFVEDNQDQRESVPRLLAGLGYKVTGVESARAALKAFENNPGRYDLVITDYDMPGTNGAQLARTFARLAPGLPVIMISGRETGKGEYDSANIRKFILKPYNRRRLSEAIRQAIDGQKEQI